MNNLSTIRPQRSCSTRTCRAITACLAFLLVVFVSFASHAEKPQAACVPGAQVGCACPGQGSGVQVCADDGRRFEACQCEAATERERTETRADEPKKEPKKKPGKSLVAGGISLITIGSLAASVGFSMILLVAAGVADDDLLKEGAAALPAFLIVSGTGSVAGGIPMIVIGAKKNRANPQDRADWEPSIGVRFAF